MSNIIEITPRNAATLGPSPLSSMLKSALEAPLVPVTGEHGFDMRPGPWKLPAVIPAAMAGEARQQLAYIDAVQMATAETTTVRGWLIALGNAVASSSAMAAEDVQTKVAAMLSLLDDYPAGVFTKATLKRAAKRFTFFPAYAELAKLLDEEQGELRAKRDKMRKIAEGVGRAQDEDEGPAGPRTLSDATQKLMEEFWARNGGRPAPRNMAASDARRMEG